MQLVDPAYKARPAAIEEPGTLPRRDRDGAEAVAHHDDMHRQMAHLLPDLRAFARFLTRDTTAADDLVQDTVVRALAAQASFQPGTNLKAWLFTIERNAFYEQMRRKRRESQVLSEQMLGAEAQSPEAHRRGDLADLQRMLWDLPPLLREALVLVGAQELSHEEAAAICGVPIGTMKARVSRARGHLARTMNAEPAERPAGSRSRTG